MIGFDYAALIDRLAPWAGVVAGAVLILVLAVRAAPWVWYQLRRPHPGMKSTFRRSMLMPAPDGGLWLDGAKVPSGSELEVKIKSLNAGFVWCRVRAVRRGDEWRLVGNVGRQSVKLPAPGQSARWPGGKLTKAQVELKRKLWKCKHRCPCRAQREKCQECSLPAIKKRLAADDKTPELLRKLL